MQAYDNVVWYLKDSHAISGRHHNRKLTRYEKRSEHIEKNPTFFKKKILKCNNQKGINPTLIKLLYLKY